MFYAGIGSRSTPQPILIEMTAVATRLEKLGCVLRSGGANGADTAFENGVLIPDNKEIYLPWRFFNDNPSPRHVITSAAYEMAAKYHPAWDRCSPAARKFHARNCYQILGYDLETPSSFVLCWTPSGVVTGGTGQALRIAIDYNIPIYNLFHHDWRQRFNKYSTDMLI